MLNFSSLLGIVLTMMIVPWVIHHISYFKRADVLARRAAKANLPGWVSSAELLFLVISEAALILLFYATESSIHRVFHPEIAFLPPMRAKLSFDFIFWLIQALAPLVAALPLGMILANLIAWSIPSIRKVEDTIMSEGVPGYAWADANMGLLKAAAMMVPTSVILAFISLLRL